MTNPRDKGRRRFLKTTALAVAALPLGALIHPQRVIAKAKAEDGHAHDYVNKAADAADHPKYQKGQTCDTCVFWQGEAEKGWGDCQHPDFADVLVKAEGWCSQWVKAP